MIHGRSFVSVALPLPLLVLLVLFLSVTSQVYNEQIMDLLSASPKPLKINEDPAKGVVVVAGLAEMVGWLGLGFRLEDALLCLCTAIAVRWLAYWTRNMIGAICTGNLRPIIAVWQGCPHLDAAPEYICMYICLRFVLPFVFFGP